MNFIATDVESVKPWTNSKHWNQYNTSGWGDLCVLIDFFIIVFSNEYENTLHDIRNIQISLLLHVPIKWQSNAFSHEI